MTPMARKTILIVTLLLFFLMLASCHNHQKTNMEPVEEVDTLTCFERLMEKGVLTAVTNCGAINYNMLNSVPTGLEYELLSDFCDAYQLKLEMVVNDDPDSCFALLDSCHVDVVATGLGLTKDLKKRYQMTNPILSERWVLVQRMPKGWNAMSTENEVENQLLRSPLDLAGKTVSVSKGSQAIKILGDLSENIGDTIYVTENDTLSSIGLVQAVAKGRIDYAVVEEYIAKITLSETRGLDMKLAVSVEQPIGWALRKQDNDSSLLLAINSWIDGIEQRHLRRVMNKYVSKGKMLVSNSEKKQNQLSEFDKSIKKTAKKIGWDWRLLASIIYQESRFKPDLESEKGAFGLMQLMPVIMENYGITYDSSPEEQIEAGGKLITHLEKSLESRVADSTERVKFVLAAYNAGLGHVYDAQRLAEKYGKSPDIWDDNVDYFILNKSKSKYYNDTCCRNGYLRGTETYRFVEEVIERYHQYQYLID